jgi:chemosensory pili system protein ChpA (sensor histidine kinase/response regulator)
LRQLKGSISIQSQLGKGSLFELTLPVSSFSTHSLLIRVRQYIYAISNRGIEEVLYPGTGELRDMGNQLIYQLDDDIYDTHIIDGLLNLPPDRRKIERGSRPVLIVKDDSGERRAILVQEVLDSRDVVVKTMGQYMPKIRGTIGATILGDGSIAPVIDLPELLRESSDYQHKPLPVSEAPASSNNRRVPYVLVVDDSLSARRSLAQFAEDMGFNVRTARDGLEAATLIQERTPDLVLADMEMPRMNGLELTAHIRANERSRDVPVIMITSRSSDKHRSSAIEKGVTHFMVKPFDEDVLAAHINDAIGLCV